MAAKYDRVAQQLRDHIANGILTPGQQLPPETELMTEFGVSLSTIRKALSILDAENLIEKRHGTGTFVKSARQRISRSTDRYQWEKDRVRQSEQARKATGATEYETGLTLQDLKFHAAYKRTASSVELSKVFDIEIGTPLLQRVYMTTRVGERAPLSLNSSYLVISMIEANPALLDAANEPWPGGTQHQLATVGIEVDRIIDRLTARPCSAHESSILDIRSGEALLALRKTSIDINERVVEVADVIWPGDRIEVTYVTHLARWGK